MDPRRAADLRGWGIGVGGGGSPGTPAPLASRTRSGWGGGLPGPRTAAVLTLAMLAFGTLTGVAASNPSGALRMLRRGPLTLLVPAPAPAATTLAEAPPPVEATSTPEPVAAPPATESTQSSEPSSSSSSSSGGGGHKKSGGSSGGSAGGGGSHLPPVKHVFLIVLADQPYAQTFGPESPAPYLAHTLEHRGELLVRFYAVAHEELPNEVALVSGLGPTPQTAADCPTYTDIIPGEANSKGQYTGQGCIYPKEAQTVGDQLTAKGLTWKVYAEGLASACQHPEFGAADPTSQAPQGDTFATFRDPFTYFDGVLHSPACAHEDVGLGGLAADLQSAKSTPTLSYIVPDLCHDGRPIPCTPGAPSGLPAAETFLRGVVPEILASPAYRHGGLLVVTTDQAPATGEYGDSSSCCEQPRFPAPLGGAGATPGHVGRDGNRTGRHDDRTHDDHTRNDNTHDDHAPNDNTHDDRTHNDNTCRDPDHDYPDHDHPDRSHLAGRDAAPLGRRAGGRAAALALRQARHVRPGTVQRLLAAAHAREPLRAAPAGLRRQSPRRRLRSVGVLRLQRLSAPATPSGGLHRPAHRLAPAVHQPSPAPSTALHGLPA